MALRSTTVGNHLQARAARARAAFREIRGVDDEARRASEIAALSTVTWRGQTLYRFRCNGTTGKGPHDINVPEALLWAVIELDAFRCPYHA